MYRLWVKAKKVCLPVSGLIRGKIACVFSFPLGILLSSYIRLPLSAGSP